MQNLFNRNLVASAVALALTAGAATMYINSNQQTFAISADKQAFLADKKAQKEKNLNRYDKPQEAVEFYVKQRAPKGSDVIPHHKYGLALDHMDSMQRYSFAAGGETKNLGIIEQWENLGPGNIGGRTRTLIIDPVDTNIIYSAGVAGGVWKSTDAGASWTPLDDSMVNLAVTTMTMSSSNNSKIYAGTGEGFFNIDSIRGDGIFMTEDAGATWTQLASTASNDDFRYVNKLAVSPADDNRLYAATRTGIMRSTDGGENWTMLMEAGVADGCMDLTVTNDGSVDSLVLSCGSFRGATVYHSADGGDTITPVIQDELLGRTTLAVAPSNSSIVYALGSTNASDTSAYRYGFYKLYRSADGGVTWEERNTNQNEDLESTLLLSNTVFGFFPECGFGSNRSFLNQGWYDNIIAVDPVNPDSVWVGGIDLFRSDDGGQNFDVVSRWWADPSLPAYAHADQHAIVFHPNYDGVNNKTLFVGNDGGIQRTENADGDTLGIAGICGADNDSEGNPITTRVNWSVLNNGYAITQFYHGAVYPDGSTFIGGTQDNGTLSGNTTNGDIWTEIAGGDGGWVAIDSRDTRVIYSEFTGLSLQRWVPETEDSAGFWTRITAGIEDAGLFPFITPYVLDSNNQDRLWIGNDRLWRTNDRGDSWTQASANISDGSIVSEWAVAPGNSELVMAGTDSGIILMSTAASSTDASTAWTETRPAEGYVSDIAIDPLNNDIAYATYSTFGIPHVWKTTDGGATWNAIDNMGGDDGLPDIPANTITIDPNNSSRIFVGTDLGVFVSADGGAKWAVDGSGFANTPVAHLEVNNGNLYAFTHGRSAYKVAINALASVNAASFMGDEDSSIAFNAESFAFTSESPEYDAIALTALPANGQLMLNGVAVTELAPIALADIANLSFMPSANYFGNVMTYWYATNGGEAVSSSAALNISVAAVNDAPMFSLSQSSVSDFNTSGQTHEISVAEVTQPANEADQVLTYSLSPADVDFLTVDFNSTTGLLKVTPIAGMSGMVEFTVTANDGQTENNMHSETVTVQMMPSASPVMVGGFEDMNVSFAEVMFGFDGEAPVHDAIMLSEMPSNGQLMIGDTALDGLSISVADLPNLMFAPEADFFGDVSVMWYASNAGEMVSGSNSLTVSIASVNDAPVFTLDQNMISDNSSSQQTHEVNVMAGSVPANEMSQVVTYSLSPMEVDFLTIDFNTETGMLKVTPILGTAGDVEFTITADDGQDANNTHSEMVQVSVTGAAQPAMVSGDEDTSIAFGDGVFTFIGTPPEYDAIVLSELPSNGQLMIGEDVMDTLEPISVDDVANLSFMPEANFFGEVAVTWQPTNGGMAVSPANSLTITVNSVNDAPVFSVDNNTFAGTNDNIITREVVVTPADVPENEADQTVTYSLSPESVDFLTIEFDTATGGFKFTPVAGATGQTDFTITANDGAAENNTHEEMVSVNIVEPTPAPQVQSSNSGGGSSMGFFSLLALPLLALRRRFK